MDLQSREASDIQLGGAVHGENGFGFGPRRMVEILKVDNFFLLQKQYMFILESWGNAVQSLDNSITPR